MADHSERRSKRGRGTVVWHGLFAEAWRRFHLTEDDAIALEDVLAADPEAGSVVRGSNGLRKSGSPRRA